MPTRLLRRLARPLLPLLAVLGLVLAAAPAAQARTDTYWGWQEWYLCGAGNVCIHTVITLQSDDAGHVRSVANESCIRATDFVVGRCISINQEDSLFYGDGQPVDGYYSSCGLPGYLACVSGQVLVVAGPWHNTSSYSHCQGRVLTNWIQTGGGWGSRADGWTDYVVC